MPRGRGVQYVHCVNKCIMVKVWGKRNTHCYMDSLHLPYFTQTAYPDNRHSPDCVLYCVGRLAIVPRNSFRCDWSFAQAHVCHSYFVLECPKHWNTRGVLILLSD